MSPRATQKSGVPITQAPVPAAVPRIPSAPKSIQKGVGLARLLDMEAVECLIHNISLVWDELDEVAFRRSALTGLEPLGILERGRHLAVSLHQHLPRSYERAVEILVASLTPPQVETDDLGLAPFFYLPHVYFVSRFGVDPGFNDGRDPFEASMSAQHQLTRRFSAEFSIRAFIDRYQERTLARLLEWTRDPDPHVRRLCSEGSRPRLPWAARLPKLIADPKPSFPILESLKDDSSLYVRRSVANHLGDIAKDHPQLAFEICEQWLEGASADRKWMIRHAVRHPARKGVPAALRLRKLAV